MITTRNQMRYNLRPAPRQVVRSQVGPPPPKKRRTATKPRRNREPKNKKRSKAPVSSKKKGQKDSQLQEIPYPPRTLHPTDQWKEQHIKGKQRKYNRPRNLKAELYLRRGKRFRVGVYGTYLGPRAKKAAKFLKDIRVPVLPYPTPLDWPPSRCLSYLRWDIHRLYDWEPRPEWDHPEVGSEAQPVRRKTRAAKSKSHLFTAPPPLANEALKHERHRLYGRFRDASLQLPLWWEPLNSIPIEKVLNHRQGTVDSTIRDDLLRHVPDPEEYSPSTSTRSSPESDPAQLRKCEEHAANSPSYTKAVSSHDVLNVQTSVFSTSGDRLLHRSDLKRNVSIATITTRTLENSCSRYCWDLLITMEPSNFPWSFQGKEELNDRDRGRHAGSIAVNDSSKNLDIRLNEAMSRVMVVYNSLDDVSEGELTYRSYMGRILADILSRDTLRAQCWVPLRPSWPFSSSPSIITVDVACIPDTSDFMWSEKMVPVLAAAQYAGTDEQLAVEQLAQAFHSTIILLILYYLDTNMTAEQPIPDWMIVFGIIYDEGGISIQEYFPILNHNTGSPADKATWNWGASSRQAARFIDSFRELPVMRDTLLASLLRIQSRASHLLSKLTEWKGFKRIASQFI